MNILKKLIDSIILGSKQDSLQNNNYVERIYEKDWELPKDKKRIRCFNNKKDSETALIIILWLTIVNCIAIKLRNNMDNWA